MARTKASVGSKASSDKGSKGYSGGNPVCPRETPKWQKPITRFFISKEDPRDEEVEVDDETATSSKPKPKPNVIQSDSEEEILIEKPKNNVLDESLDLEPLNGEDSHKIEEYYPKGSKGKGVGKKSKGKENRGDVKRVREDEDVESDSKRVKNAFRTRLKEPSDHHRWGPVGLMPNPELRTT
uniref:PCNA-associated factor n=1 Tax=Spodoptera frugiperda TaxID=7108 RepID=A0A2H1VK24_SPOFR